MFILQFSYSIIIIYGVLVTSTSQVQCSPQAQVPILGFDTFVFVVVFVVVFIVFVLVVLLYLYICSYLIVYLFSSVVIIIDFYSRIFHQKDMGSIPTKSKFKKTHNFFPVQFSSIQSSPVQW